MDAPAWIIMWLIAGAIFVASKVLTLASTTVHGHALAWLGWPGLDAARFFTPTRHVVSPRPSEWGFAVFKTFAGAALFWFGGLAAGSSELGRGWAGMIGVVFMLHFGLFHLLSCWWRTLGRDAPPIMDHPWAATSVAEFWGRRWNQAFRDLTHRFLFRPLAKGLNPQLALTLGFVISGLVHELVITVPAGGGYGGPTAYFCIQAVAIVVEHSRLGSRLRIGHGWISRLFTIEIVLAPLGLLFPPVFIRAIVLPMMNALGAA